MNGSRLHLWKVWQKEGNRAALLTLMVFACLVLLDNGLHAQQTPQFTQFTEIRSYFNPAATAADNVMRIGMAGRYQWLGLEDPMGQPIGPQSFMGYADIPLIGINSGMGLLALYNQTAYDQTIFLRLNGAHHLQTGSQGVISLGLSVDYIHKTFDFESLPSGPPSIGGTTLGLERSSGVDLGAGLFYHHEEGHFFGFSGHNLLEAPMTFSGFNFGFERQFHAMAGTTISIIDSRTATLALLPAILVHSTAALVPQYTAQATIVLNDRYFAGLAYRYEDAIGGIIGAVIGNFRVGLSYDYTTSLLRNAGSIGSPEITLSWGRPSVPRMRWEGRCYP